MKKVLVLIFSLFILLPSFGVEKLKKSDLKRMIQDLEAKGILDKEGAKKAYKKLEEMSDEELKKLEEDTKKVLEKK